MKRILVLSVLSLFFIAGCNSEDQDYTGDPTIEGYLVKVEDKEILVVNGITKEQAINMSLNELSDVDGKQYDAHIFHIDFNISGFFKGGANESYPAQSELGKIVRGLFNLLQRKLRTVP
ncbi:DUF3221 domain-containing protein [Halobacillus sp. A5]|uniref:DUF3221 domain-containing protein n=1 Tax=Halobacillus sp. A5 TaxID=2880263 RepID=UPI0020A68508|nr:DUF3221 domain-containing protein [Halobacillus sp. A5]MCP3027058.1 YobA family protein [Halobacillus sp. A5]